MRVKKEVTVAVACRVTVPIQQKLIEGAQELHLTPSTYAAMVLINGLESNSPVPILEQRILDAEARLKVVKEENEQLRKASPWQLEPLSRKLAQVLKNEEVLISFYQIYKRDAFPTAEIQAAGLKVEFLLSAAHIGGVTYWCMNQYGWAFTDNDRTKMMIRKIN